MNLDSLLPSGVIQLQHDLLQGSVDAVESFVSIARAKGYSFVSLERCLWGPNFQRNPSWVRAATCMMCYGQWVLLRVRRRTVRN